MPQAERGKFGPTDECCSEDEVIETLRRMHQHAILRSLNMTYMFQGAFAFGECGKNTGLIHREKFKMTIGTLFQDMAPPLTELTMNGVAKRYEAYPGDSDIRWRQFCIEVRSHPVPSPRAPQPPTPALLSKLGEMSVEADKHALDLPQAFKRAGANPSGVMGKDKFNSALKVLFHRIHLDHTALKEINETYAAGPPDGVNDGSLDTEWKRFSEDVASFSCGPVLQ